jgi:NAD+ synthase (glutamine-hydrolysing)
MAHYHVNAGVPETLIQYLVRWVAKTGQLGPSASAALEEVSNTTISPELVLGESVTQLAQRTEQVVGPYDLQDFHLYYIFRFGFSPTKAAFLAWSAWREPDRGAWPGISPDARHQIGGIKRWLAVF